MVPVSQHFVLAGLTIDLNRYRDEYCGRLGYSANVVSHGCSSTSHSEGGEILPHRDGDIDPDTLGLVEKELATINLS